MRKLLRAVSACAAIALSCSAIAQSNFASLHGVVRDPHQQPVANASVVVTAEATGATRRLTTNPDGFYNAPALAAGEYTVSVTSSGMVQLRRNLTLEVGQSLDIDFQLQLSSVAQSVTVKGGSVIMDSTKTDVGEVIPPENIRNLPLNGRMILDLALTVPGTHMGSGAQTGDANPLYWRPGQDSAISIGGSRPNANYFLLDGATNTDPTFWTQNISLSPDAIQEFRVEASSYSADEGGAGGGQINIVTRSGTSHFHGALYEYLRNSILDAHSFEQMGDANHLVQNQFGGSVGGPVLRARRTYFFANFEAYRHVQADTAIKTVPTLDEINGDFSMSGVDIYNPDSYQMVDGKIVRDQFPNNKIPTEMLSPVAVQFMTKYLPRPNMMSMGGVDSNNYMDVRNERQNFNQGTFRIDHDFANGDVLFVRYSGSNESGFTPQNLPGFGAYNDNFAQQ
ncbi:MAG TPA: carboxypeptidase-like regulatory domain-containing protein, partial [Acidobacteriaceae bacterium]|nr:carboxypeptidase-like regulatory domain-containing protein [Acidobacteriaceae bacterium]